MMPFLALSFAAAAAAGAWRGPLPAALELAAELSACAGLGFFRFLLLAAEELAAPGVVPTALAGAVRAAPLPPRMPVDAVRAMGRAAVASEATCEATCAWEGLA